ncbi:Glutathione S-transferase C-terminal-like protein [Dioscorea alata]|uniref:Glutathione S-transferase C-terminal-like protein n=1 Tax=Dioscorea alata TaxID=55571 RepID=A0ACB7TWG8_DIOAL|nr:Glutathione S-transferase C-terminal-like protein [Dioscorea alata]
MTFIFSSTIPYKTSINTSTTTSRTSRRRRRRRRRRRCSNSGNGINKGREEAHNGTKRTSSSCKEVEKRLQALKDLIPRRSSIMKEDDDDDQSMNVEKLFEDTAGYIVLLKAQVEVLNHLVQLYQFVS